MRRLIQGVALAGAVALAGCGRKPPPPPPPAPNAEGAADPARVSAAANPVNPTATPDAQEKARVAQAVAMREGKMPAPPAITLRGGEPATPEVMAAYNQQLARLIFERHEGPETMEELVRRWPMPKLPTPPAGKQIVYDARNRIIVLSPP